MKKPIQRKLLWTRVNWMNDMFKDVSYKNTWEYKYTKEERWVVVGKNFGAKRQPKTGNVHPNYPISIHKSLERWTGEGPAHFTSSDIFEEWFIRLLVVLLWLNITLLNFRLACYHTDPIYIDKVIGYLEYIARNVLFW